VPLPCGCLVGGTAKGKYPDKKLPCASRAGSSTRKVLQPEAKGGVTPKENLES